VKQHLAALGVLFDWLVVGQVVPANSRVSCVAPPSVRKVKKPVLTAEEARAMLVIIDVTNASRPARSGADRIDGLHVRTRQRECASGAVRPSRPRNRY